MGVLLSRNLDRQTAKSVFISQFGIISINGIWLSSLFLFLSDRYTFLKDWTSNFYLLTLSLLIPFYIIFLLIPFLEGLRRAEKQREILYEIRQKWLDRVSDILEVPTPSLYIPKLELLLRELADEKTAFIENDEMIKQLIKWDEEKVPNVEDKPLDKSQIMHEACLKSKELDPRFQHLDFLESLRIYVEECISQLKITSQKGDTELVATASIYSTVYHSQKDEITKIIEVDRQTKPGWTVALATIITTFITLVLTPVLNNIGNFIAKIFQL
jgi:hypothetical protein